MKKRKKEIIGYIMIILLGVGCFYLMCLRAEQIDKEAKREEVNKAISEIMY